MTPTPIRRLEAAVLKAARKWRTYVTDTGIPYDWPLLRAIDRLNAALSKRRGGRGK